MKTWMRIARIWGTGLLLAGLLGLGGERSGSRVAQAQASVDWNITSQTTDMQNSDGSSDLSSSSEQHSSDGQDFNDQESRHENPDGSSSEHEQTDYDNHKGTKGGFRRDTETDKDGNRKVHLEEVWQENGKCEIVIIDEEYDKNNHLINRTKKEMPCSLFNLEVSREATLSVNGATTLWGPDTAVIPLGFQSGTYTGNYTGKFHATISGKCSGAFTYPASFDVTAKEDEFGDLDFSVKVTMSMVGAIMCSGGGGGPVGNAPVTFTRNFTIPAEDGASKVFTVPMGSGGQLTDTFTLKKR